VSCIAQLRLDRRFLGWAIAWSIVALVGLGIVAAIIPNPVFGRQIPPGAFAIGVWLVSAPLIGVIGATYSSPPAGWAGGPGVVALAPRGAGGAATAVAARGGSGMGTMDAERRTGRLGTLAGVGAFLAIGCPVCNKVALVLLGAGGTMAIWAPLQPLIGAASVVLLAVTVGWRLRLRRSGACAV
jgi:hypothetical protein